MSSLIHSLSVSQRSLKRKSLRTSELLPMLCPDFSRCKIIVIGDVMLDRYWHGDTSRISPEAPVPVVRIEQDEERVGGAANVAVNVQSLSVQTTLISVIGKDETGGKLQGLLKEKGVQCRLIESLRHNTTLKLRVLGRHQQLIRLDFESNHPCSLEQILESLEQLISSADILILSDYAKGVLANPKPLIECARRHGVKVLVDPKNADLSVYQGANILTPNLSEFEAAVGPCNNTAEIEKNALNLVEQLGLDALLVTRGSQGMSLIQADKPARHICAKAKEVFDITGAGDTVIAVLAACLAAGTPIEEASEMANIAAGIAVGRLGTATITREELQAALGAAENVSLEKGVTSLTTLLPEIARRKVRNEKIVFTNGCFDVLHAGHVTYLQQARALGDCLVVAVNDDDSVRRLKGQTRPINPLPERLQVLAALACVDYVISFSEDTPLNVIEQVLPHILVKGGDYTPEEVVGGTKVINHGGKIKILPFVPGCSTTSMLERVNKGKVQSGEVLEEII